MINRRLQELLCGLLLILCLFSCRSIPFDTESPETVLVSSGKPHPSITVETYRNKEYPLIYHLTTIDLSDSSLFLAATPLSSETEGCVTGETTLSFARRTGAVVAVNATPFSLPEGGLLSTAGNRSFTGLFISDGISYGSADEHYSALGFTADKRAFILEAQTEPLPGDTTFLFGGFWVILKNGELYGSYKDIQDSRTAAGISADGTILYLLSVEGELPFQSKGLSYHDCAEILKKAGAYNAVQLDGGSSVSLIIQGKNQLSYPSFVKVAGSFGLLTY